LGVASTKAFTTQLVAAIHIAVCIAPSKKQNYQKRTRRSNILLPCVASLPVSVANMHSTLRAQIREWAKHFGDKNMRCF